MLKTVIVSAINRGMATAMFSAATVVLFVAFPETYLFLIALAPSGKIYAVTLLSNLNTRMHPRDQMVNNGVELHSVPAGTRVSAHAQAFIAVPDTRNLPTSPPNSAQSDDLAFEKAR
ncbi:hypothetical protein B0H11DRAFT_434626 [Mycena galericulata]|nr:hypothetical protein B0H11DRAFT_434626 [Mycena galericulata]